MNSFDLYLKTNTRKLFLSIAIPGAISMLASSLWSFFDSIFVGRFLGETAFAAMNLTMPFVMIINALADMIGVGSAVPIAIALGRGERDQADNEFTCACLLIVALGAAGGLLFFTTAPLIVRLMGAQGELAKLSVAYLRTYALFAPFNTIVFATDNFWRICGRIKGSMMLNILMSIIILSGEYLCVAVLPLGIIGSPLAVCGGMLICALIALLPFFRNKMTLRFCRPRFSAALLKAFFSNGLPNFLNNMATRITSILMNAILLKMGGTGAVTIYGILVNANDFIMQLLYGVCDSLQPAIGYNWGNGQTRRVKQIARHSLTASAIVCLTGMVVMLAFPGQLIRLYLKQDSRYLLPAAVQALRLYSLANLVRWFPFFTQEFLIAVDMPKPASVLSLASTFVVPVSLLVLLAPLELTGIWLNTAATSLIVSLLAYLILMRKKKQGAFDLRPADPAT